MDRTPQPLIVVAMCLAALAGFVDALAFTSIGGFFASFMSGNSTRLGVGLGGRGLSDAAMALGLVMSFVSGVIVSSVIARARRERAGESIMVVVTGLLAAAAAMAMLQPGPIVLIFLAMAMGCENGVFNRDGERGFGVTYLSGALVRMGQKAANALMGDADRWGWVPYLALWLGFVAGAVLGAASQFRWGWDALWAAPVAAAVIAVALRRIRAPAV
ncbi:MAG: YoaK family protein [Pseudomonadota bacterium]